MAINKNILVGLDFETYSACDLFKHGLERYVSDPTFKPLLACIRYPEGSNVHLDLVEDYDGGREHLRLMAKNYQIAGHNVGFEERVLKWMGIDLAPERFVDSAAVARAAGVAGKLEAAAPQFLGVDKMEEGRHLIQLFSIPQKGQLDPHFNQHLIELNPDKWELFKKYCMVDARLSRRIVNRALNSNLYSDTEHDYEVVTRAMNQTGWRVDMQMVEEMNRRYHENMEATLHTFRQVCNAPDLNLNSLKQLKEWCAERGIKARSFDEKAVARMITTIEKKCSTLDPWSDKHSEYSQVLSLLRTKQVLGGSSLKKLEVLLNMTDEHGILRDQYVHIGAGQTFRTTGRSVQMQNLKRIGDNPDVMEHLIEGAPRFDDLRGFEVFEEVDWDNDKLARNLRQVFTSRHPGGYLIVGDFSSVESRGLAWLFNEEWKLEAYRNGKDLYKVLAAQIYSISYDEVLKPQRQTGKVGELSCGYGAGADAVESFAKGMGVEMSNQDAAVLVHDWRGVNPKIVSGWAMLDQLLATVVDTKQGTTVSVGDRCYLTAYLQRAPSSLSQQDGKAAHSLYFEFKYNGNILFTRIFHGIHRKGRNLGYYKPSELKNGDLWKDWFVNPKTKQRQDYTIYGGKLSGILTQSLCREIFFDSLLDVHRWVASIDGLELVGQFHDEIVLDWSPMCQYALDEIKQMLTGMMFVTHLVPGFPMAAEIKHDYRYTK